MKISSALLMASISAASLTQTPLMSPESKTTPVSRECFSAVRSEVESWIVALGGAADLMDDPQEPKPSCAVLKKSITMFQAQERERRSPGVDAAALCGGERDYLRLLSAMIHHFSHRFEPYRNRLKKHCPEF